MTKKFFQIKNLNERFDQPSNNKTYTQQSHILHKEKKKLWKTTFSGYFLLVVLWRLQFIL